MNGYLVSGIITSWNTELQISATRTVSSYIAATDSFLAQEQFKQMYNQTVTSVQSRELGPCQ